MTCPNCGAAMRLDPDKDYLICDYCGNLHFPDVNSDGVRVLGEPSQFPCPVCQIPLVHAGISGYRIQYCARCRGMLISMGTFPFMIQSLRSNREMDATVPPPPDWNGLKRHIRCPKCGYEMDTHPYGGAGNVIIDDCERCALDWLDYGELRRIVTAPDRHYDDPG
jgi:Zn-finger nucleic acid-binding protein